MSAMTGGSQSAVDWTSDILINGQSTAGAGNDFTVDNPATEGVIATLREASAAQVEAAILGARAAFEGDSWKDPVVRRRTLHALADQMERNREMLIHSIIEEVGTPVAIAGPLQIDVAIQLIRHYADKAVVDWTRQLGSDRNPHLETESLVNYLPVGVVSVITPYNYPLLLLALKIAPALAVGCTVVIQPSPQTPLTTLLLGKLMLAAGFPEGVVNIVVGGATVGRLLTEHPQVDKVSFTGSVAVGRSVMQQAAGTIKGVTLELGGKAPAIILPDAPIEQLLPALHLRYSRNAGQGCASPTRILVQQDRMGDFIALSRPFIETIPVGDPWHPDTVAGPVISAVHRDRIEACIDRALAAGARILAGGGRPDIPRGYYMRPTLIGDLDNSFEIAREELFGPVAVVMPYRDIDDAVRIANDSELGLAGYVFGPLDSAKAVARQLRTGSVYINGGGALRMEAPMGGLKQSGIGREYGDEGLHEFLEAQHIQWPVEYPA